MEERFSPKAPISPGENPDEKNETKNLFQEIAANAIREVQRTIIKSATKEVQKSEQINKPVSSLFLAVHDVRDKIDNSIHIKKLIRVDPDNTIFEFQEKIDKVQKYSLGNCREFAYSVMEHILQFNQKNPNNKINAECFHIKNGDHVFVIMGRDPNSDAKNPLTWGDAYICDAWSETNSFYKASEYLSKLKNYRYEYSDHFLEPFNPTKHELEPKKNINTTHLGKRITPEYFDAMLSIYHKKIYSIAECTEIFKQQLIKIQNDIDSKDPKYIILANEIKRLNSLLDNLTLETTKDLMIDQYNYKKSKDFLESSLSNILKTTLKTISFTSDEKKILGESNEPTKLKRHFFRIFNIKPIVYTKMDQAIKDFSINLREKLTTSHQISQKETNQFKSI